MCKHYLPVKCSCAVFSSLQQTFFFKLTTDILPLLVQCFKAAAHQKRNPFAPAIKHFKWGEQHVAFVEYFLLRIQQN